MFRVLERCESRGGRPGLPVPNSLHGLFGREAALKKKTVLFRVLERCESRGGRPGLPVPNSLHGLFGREAALKKKTVLFESSGAV